VISHILFVVIILFCIVLCYNNYLTHLENKQDRELSHAKQQERFDKLPEAQQYRIDRDSLWKAVYDDHKAIRAELTRANKSNRRLNREVANLKRRLGLGAFKKK
jgi:hypothetical protein